MIKKIIIAVLLILIPVMGYSQDKWKEYKSRHIIIFYKDAPRDFVESVAETAEQYYTEISRNLGYTRYKGWAFEKRAKIYIYEDKEDYVSSARQASWSHGIAKADEKIIRTFPSSYGFFDSILPHEMGHIIFREFIGYKAQIPLWMEEGVAMYQEKARRWGANKIVKKAIDEKKFIPLEELSEMRLTNNMNRELVDLYYAEAASVVYYMIVEFGNYRFMRFCRKLKNGNTFEQALKSEYWKFKTVNELNDAWVRYINSKK